MTVANRRVARLARAAGAILAAFAVLATPSIAAAHGLSPIYQSPLPLAVYLVGAATTVGLSFVFVLARDMRAAPVEEGRLLRVPAVVRVPLRIVGVVGWAWILAQGIAGGSSAGAVATLFLWVYGWVGVAMISALAGPIWEWLDPFATLYDSGAWVLRRLGLRGWAPSGVPPALSTWPAVAGLVFFIWLELVGTAGSSTLTVVLAGYTLLTLAMMAQCGRDAWREHGETFTVWFRTLGRLAPYALVPAAGTAEPEDADDVDPDAVDPAVVRRRPFASGLLGVRWDAAHIVLVAAGTASIIFDGLSQTTRFADLFGNPGLVARTILLLAFLGLVAGAALAVARAVSPGAIGAGLVPIAVGYLIAHYLTYLLIDGQRIAIAVSDPLQQGWDLFGTAFYSPDGSWLPAGLVWTVQLASVVGGHMLGAWAGHVTASRDIEAQAGAREPRDLRHRRIPGRAIAPVRHLRVREVPLALMMVGLTTLTLWSLGQAIVQEPAAQAPRAIVVARG